MKLSNRTVHVTGGTFGIGIDIAEAFYQSRSRIVIFGRNRKKLLKAGKKFPWVTALHCDVGDAQRKSLTALSTPV
jgi:short-subunit dehydrogenase involved in D-alanine esterification of teichoic acids